jgi:rhodanese-related sulfurtransferase
MAIVDVDRETLKQGLASGEMRVIDVREPNEFEAGHIPGAVPYPLSEFDLDAFRALLAREGGRPVISCQSGNRSARLLEYLQGQGVELSEHYGGGFKDWFASGEPVE